MCIDPGQCRAILEAQCRNPEVFAVTAHNSRYTPRSILLKQMLLKNTIGKIRSFHYEELLDKTHGTSYFRRWNSRRVNTNGLQIHKSSHHFDLLNWLFASRAAEVTASGALIAYGGDRHTRCRDCASECPARFIPDPVTEQIWFKYTAGEEYTPDLCIWSPEIDTEDVLTAGLRFQNGIYGSYHLCAHADYESERIQIEGETGRIECECRIVRHNGGTVHGEMSEHLSSLTLYRYGSEPEIIEIPNGIGGHGGADDNIFGDLFSGKHQSNMASLEDGVQAVLTGYAVTESIRTGRMVNVQNLL